MANVDGDWDVSIKTPIGDQKLTLTIVSSGDSFSGSASGAMGSSEISGGKLDGDRLTWSMSVTSPMPLTLEGDATVQGNSLEGDVKAGAFGKMKLTGTRK